MKQRINVDPVNSEQLVLRLEDRVAPWGGRSPRELTRAWGRFSFVRKGTGRLDPPISLDLQLELFPEGTHYGS